MREVVLDTETTGLDPTAGHRIVEIGCIELENHVPTGREFQAYVNPEREMPAEAFEIHGLSGAFLAKHPVFADVVGGFLEFIGDATLVIHNAAFDLGFINAELARCTLAALPSERAVDTVRMARRKHPGAPANLDALCRRFGVDTAARTRHGALLDAQLLAEVYLALKGGRQPGLMLAATAAQAATVAAELAATTPRAPRPHAPSDAERAAHEAFIDNVEKPIWRS